VVRVAKATQHIFSMRLPRLTSGGVATGCAFSVRVAREPGMTAGHGWEARMRNITPGLRRLLQDALPTPRREGVLAAWPLSGARTNRCDIRLTRRVRVAGAAE
jgi:hypothetical protein